MQTFEKYSESEVVGTQAILIKTFAEANLSSIWTSSICIPDKNSSTELAFSRDPKIKKSTHSVLPKSAQHLVSEKTASVAQFLLIKPCLILVGKKLGIK